MRALTVTSAADEDDARAAARQAQELDELQAERAERRAEHAPAETCSRAVRAPCTSCPWRTDAIATRIPGLNAAMAEDLRGACEDQHGPLMACHQSREGAEHPCAGWLAVYGHRSIRVRAAVMQGRIPIDALEAQRTWPELHEDFDAMLAGLYETGMAP